MTEAEWRTVAVVDDDHAVRDSLRFLLEVIVTPSRCSHRQPSSYRPTCAILPA
jgi:FixJ family two-component response regulator